MWGPALWSHPHQIHMLQKHHISVQEQVQKALQDMEELGAANGAVKANHVGTTLSQPSFGSRLFIFLACHCRWCQLYCRESGGHAMKATQKIRVNPWLGFLIYIYIYIYIVYCTQRYIYIYTHTHTHIWIHVFWSRLAKCRQEFRRHNFTPLAVIRVVRMCVARSTKVWNQLFSCRWALGGSVLGKSGRFSVATRETTFLVACHGLNQLVWFAQLQYHRDMLWLFQSWLRSECLKLGV